MIKKEFTVTIEVDEDKITELYPNYRFNWGNPDDFIEATMKSITIEGDTDMSKDGMKSWGYSITYKEKEDDK